MMLPFIHSFAHSPNVLSVYYSSATLPHGKESDMHPPPPESQYLVVDRLINRSLQYNDNYCFSHVRFCATPWTAARQAPPSLGFSSQEDWSGLPFPSPNHESEKWKWSRSVVSDSLQPHVLQPSRLLHPWDSPGQSTGVGCHCLLRWPLYTPQICVQTQGFLNTSIICCRSGVLNPWAMNW